VADPSFFATGPDVAHAIAYGVYDLSADAGWVNVGVDHDTAAFAVASIRGWWQARGHDDYPHATRLLITADAGGSNSYRTRASFLLRHHKPAPNDGVDVKDRRPLTRSAYRADPGPRRRNRRCPKAAEDERKKINQPWGGTA
jgi:hypothetical protein